MNQKGITVIVLSRGLDALLAQCIKETRQAIQTLEDKTDHCVVVVDNASPRPYVERRINNLGAELMRFDTHHSFAAANNLAAKRYPNRFYLLLNNDVLLHERTLGFMLQEFKTTPNLGICGSRLVFPDGTLQHCGVVFGPGEKGPYHLLRTSPSECMPRITREFQAVTGACMLIRHKLWEENKGLSTEYPFGLEDIDFCLRSRQKGWRITCCNQVESLHFEATTPGRSQLDVKSRRLFMERWQGRYTVDGE
ncbi:glycosyltransferase family 2 protein [Dethiosulfatarculus sandiegensis]|uniref:Uncharacterized protein n=1 Tax=Dethiosulfatarculus sandiegensis TaxID=1429043 RepID=A0A0D2JBD0_9BACT|nr:glycosyltransferase [Dethiosulfatarculus sandiegensis]KIX15434.1 hypothetical protein X474_03840 [Dethiosulfatarculus sandiegensis]